MRTRTTLLTVLFILATNAFAGGGWATSAVSITKNNGSPYLYPLNREEGWTDGDWELNIPFDSYNFGTPTSLILNGGDGNGWSDDTPGYTTSSFVLYYRVYKVGTTPGSWSQIALDNQSYKSGMNYIFNKTNAAVNILALATTPGTNTYTLEITMSKNQLYTGGNWNSMIPGGQTIAYNSATAGYKATFTKSFTSGLQKTTQDVKVYGVNNLVKAIFSGTAEIELSSISGQLINKTTATNQYTKEVKPGIYLLRINGETHKVQVK